MLINRFAICARNYLKSRLRDPFYVITAIRGAPDVKSHPEEADSSAGEYTGETLACISVCASKLLDFRDYAIRMQKSRGVGRFLARVIPSGSASPPPSPGDPLLEKKV